jgi:hypothetical protein
MTVKVLLSSMHSHMEGVPTRFGMGANTGKVVHLNVMLIMNGCKVSLLSVLLDSFISFSPYSVVLQDRIRCYRKFDVVNSTQASSEL